MESLKRIVPEALITTLPILILGSRKDWLLPEKRIIGIGRVYNTNPVIFPDISHDMMLDPNWIIAADQILSFLNGNMN